MFFTLAVRYFLYNLYVATSTMAGTYLLWCSLRPLGISYALPRLPRACSFRSDRSVPPRASLASLPWDLFIYSAALPLLPQTHLWHSIIYPPRPPTQPCSYRNRRTKAWRCGPAKLRSRRPGREPRALLRAIRMRAPKKRDVFDM